MRHKFNLAIFIMAGLFIFTHFAWAGGKEGKEEIEAREKKKILKYLEEFLEDFTLSGYTEFGRKSTADDYLEEDEDLDYTYQNYHLKIDHKINPRLKYEASTFFYDKDYKADDALDNVSRIFKTKATYFIKKIWTLSPKAVGRFKYKEKRYNNTPDNEYDQVAGSLDLHFSKDDKYFLKLGGGINRYDYIEEEDELKIDRDVDVKAYFFDKRLFINGYYWVQRLEEEKIGKWRTKDKLRGGVEYKCDQPIIYKIIGKAERGEGDTKEDDNRDYDYDYKYRKYTAKTEHRLAPDLDMDLKYEYFNKNYIVADLDHNGYEFQNIWRYDLFDDERQKVWVRLAFKHKDLDYTERAGRDYRKETVEVTTNYKIKNNWKITSGFVGSFYSYTDRNNNKDRYCVLVGGEKYLLKDNDLRLRVDLKYRYTDFEWQNDVEHGAVRVSFRYRF